MPKLITDDMFPEDRFEEIKSIVDDMLHGCYVDMDPETERLVNLRILQLDQVSTGDTEAFDDNVVDDIIAKAEETVTNAKKKKEKKIIVSNFEITLTEDELNEVKDAASGTFVRSNPYTEYNQPKKIATSPDEIRMNELLDQIRAIGESIYKQDEYRKSMQLRKEYVELFLKHNYPYQPLNETIRAYNEGKIKINLRPPTLYLSNWRMIKDPNLLMAIIDGDEIKRRSSTVNSLYTEKRSIKIPIQYRHYDQSSGMLQLKNTYNPVTSLSYFGIPSKLVKVLGVNDNTVGNRYTKEIDKRPVIDLMTCTPSEFKIKKSGKDPRNYDSFGDYLANIQKANHGRLIQGFKHDILKGYNELINGSKQKRVQLYSHQEAEADSVDPFREQRSMEIFKERQEKRLGHEEDIMDKIN